MKKALLLLFFLLCIGLNNKLLFAQNNSKVLSAEEKELVEQLQKLEVDKWEILQEKGLLKPTVLNHSRKLGDLIEKPFAEELAPFYHGVASGDPRSDKVIIWTRVTPEEEAPITVKWYMATDLEMTDIVQSGEVETNADRDYTVKIDVQNLEAGTYYYYSFTALGANSLVGRTKTAPTGDVEHMRFGVVSCSHYQQGYFNAYGRLAEHNDLEAVFHLGDYIYEYGVDSDFLPDEGARPHEPANEILTVADYRIRHGLYKLDPDLRRLHQMYPFITIWDDHETANDAWTGGAQNHDPATEGEWEDRKANGKQVYFEWMPIRDAEGDNPQRIYRNIRYGDLVEFMMLDTRLEGREEQSLEESVFTNPDRTLLGQEQLDWLLNGLSNSTAQWKVLGNQVVMSNLDLLGIITNEDGWDGYPVERDKIINHIKENDINNMVVITGDFHLGLALDVHATPKVPYDAATGEGYDPATGDGANLVEFVVHSVTTANLDDADFLPNLDTALIHQLALTSNPHGKFVNSADHGYYILDINKEQTQADYYLIETKLEPNTNQRSGESWYTENNNSFLKRAPVAIPSITEGLPEPPPIDPLEDVVGVKDVKNEANLSSLVILGNYPNPFSNTTEINYALSKPQHVTVTLHDVTGKQLLTLSDQKQTVGNYSLRIGSKQLPNGVYVYRFTTEEGSISRKVILQK